MKDLKRFTAIALAATMTIGSTMTVFASDVDGDAGETPAASTESSSDGTGSYEGGEMKYPTLSVTLPTIPAGTYDYIADPNNLIELTKAEDGTAAKDSNATYTGTTGIFFLTSTADDGAKTYTQDSAALSLENQNAQDIDVTVKLEQKTAGDAAIKYADSATFAEGDKEKKLYLAITDGTKTEALAAGKAATITTTVEGVPDNFEAGYNNGKYEYTKKADASGWNDCSFNMTGALNKAAAWGDSVTFPEIKVTWSYAEHNDGYLSSTTMSASSNSVTVSLPEGVTVSKIALRKAGATTSTTMSSGNHYTKSGNTYTFTASMVSAWSGATLTFTFSDSTTEVITIQ